MHNRVYLDVEICEVFSLFLSYFYVVSIFFFQFVVFCPVLRLCMFYDRFLHRGQTSR